MFVCHVITKRALVNLNGSDIKRFYNYEYFHNHSMFAPRN